MHGCAEGDWNVHEQDLSSENMRILAGTENWGFVVVVVWRQHKLCEKMGVKMLSECNLNIRSFRALGSTFKTYGSQAMNFLL